MESELDQERLGRWEAWFEAAGGTDRGTVGPEECRWCGSNVEVGRVAWGSAMRLTWTARVDKFSRGTARPEAECLWLEDHPPALLCPLSMWRLSGRGLTACIVASAQCVQPDNESQHSSAFPNSRSRP
ncbi:hypothetical protein GUJ93_ZPchr0008g12599 [Zizania palustris]|uniref:Uncharacterized protein n=1 Tax=Zizania palustris TaxID=103762 RepID=A0A8J5R4R5_ZIZPA|nr:hypothetical protein GUJ93_ZPchr0008g12599 [Zizania palustris]